MKVSQIISAKQKGLAQHTGRELARMYRDMNFTPTLKHFFTEGLLVELNSQEEVSGLHHAIQSILGELGFHVQFGSHFSEHLFGREKHIPARAIISAFGKLKTKYPKQLEQLRIKSEKERQRNPLGVEVLFQSYGLNLNILFAIRGELIELISIMNKDPRNYRVNGEDTVVLKG